MTSPIRSGCWEIVTAEIERFLGVLVNLVLDRQVGPLAEQERIALSTSLRCFREAAPKHTGDEEESLFPRMRAAGRAGTEALFARIASLEDDHQAAVKGHEEVDQLGQAWLNQGQLSSKDVSRLLALVRELAALYRGHIAIEDTRQYAHAARSARMTACGSRWITAR